MSDALAKSFAARADADRAKRQAVATLAAGIIQARHAVSVAEIQKAYEDATFIIGGAQPNDSQWVEWAQHNGVSVPAGQAPPSDPE